MSKKIITKKQYLITLLLYIFRFLNSKQIQQFLKHKDHRRVNAWLKDLTTKNLIIREFKPIYGILTKPALFYLSKDGRDFIRHSFSYRYPTYLRRLSTDCSASKAFKIRCQLIADWYLINAPQIDRQADVLNGKTGIGIVDTTTHHLTEECPGEKIPLNRRQFFTPADFPDFILLEKIKPHAYVRHRTKKGIDHALLFVIDAYISKFMLRNTITTIFTTLDEEDWENESITSLQFYFLCPNNQIIIYLKRLLPSKLETYYSQIPVSFNMCTRNQFNQRKNGIDQQIKWVTISNE